MKKGSWERVRKDEKRRSGREIEKAEKQRERQKKEVKNDGEAESLSVCRSINQSVSAGGY